MRRPERNTGESDGISEIMDERCDTRGGGRGADMMQSMS